MGILWCLTLSFFRHPSFLVLSFKEDPFYKYTGLRYFFGKFLKLFSCILFYYFLEPKLFFLSCKIDNRQSFLIFIKNIFEISRRSLI